MPLYSSPTSISAAVAAAIAGAGLANVGGVIDVENVDGSIIINSDDIKVGVLATDDQHGDRGGGTQHSPATTSSAGFQSSLDKTLQNAITSASLVVKTALAGYPDVQVLGSLPSGILKVTTSTGELSTASLGSDYINQAYSTIKHNGDAVEQHSSVDFNGDEFALSEGMSATTVVQFSGLIGHHVVPTSAGLILGNGTGTGSWDSVFSTKFLGRQTGTDQNSFYELDAGTFADVSPGDRARLIYNRDTKTAQISLSGSDYTDIGGGGGVGVTGEKFISIINAAAQDSNDSNAYKVSGAFYFNPADYVLTGATRSYVLRAVVGAGNNTVSCKVELYNVTDSASVYIFTYTGSNTQKLEQTLTSPTNLPASDKLYELRIYLTSASTGATDTVILYSADLRITNTVD